MTLQSLSEEEYERLRVEDIENTLAFVNALPKAPREPLGVDMKPYEDFDEIHRELRVRSIFYTVSVNHSTPTILLQTPFSPEKGIPKAPLDQLPLYLRVPPDEGAIYIPNYTRSTLNFGIPLNATEIIRCALRLNIPIKPIDGEDEDERYDSCLASVRRAGRNIAKYITLICKHVITFRLAAGIDGLFVFAMYSNYDRGDRRLVERDEKLIIDVIGKVLATQRPAKWYYEGYTT